MSEVILPGDANSVNVGTVADSIDGFAITVKGAEVVQVVVESSTTV
jgi:hypothetical protein